MLILYAGLFRAASELLRGLDYDLAHSEPHVILLKYLANASEVTIAIEHIKSIRETSLSMLEVILSELSVSLSSSSKLEPILQSEKQHKKLHVSSHNS